MVKTVVDDTNHAELAARFREYGAQCIRCYLSTSATALCRQGVTAHSTIIMRINCRADR
jgi:hypothetical protein